MKEDELYNYRVDVDNLKRKHLLNSNLTIGIAGSTIEYLKRNKDEKLLKYIKDNAFDRKRNSFYLAVMMNFKFCFIQLWNWFYDNRKKFTSIILISISLILNLLLILILAGVINA